MAFTVYTCGLKSLSKYKRSQFCVVTEWLAHVYSLRWYCFPKQGTLLFLPRRLGYQRAFKVTRERRGIRPWSNDASRYKLFSFPPFFVSFSCFFFSLSLFFFNYVQFSFIASPFGYPSHVCARKVANLR